MTLRYWTCTFVASALLSGFVVAQQEYTRGSFPREQSRENAEVHYLSYEAMSVLADSIAEKLVTWKPKPRTLIVCGSTDCQDLIQARLSYELFVTDTEELIAEYDRLQPRAQSLATRLANLKEEDLEMSDGSFTLKSGGKGAAGVKKAIKSVTGLIAPTKTALSEAFSLVELLRKTTIDVRSASITATDSHLATEIVSRMQSRPEASAIEIYLPEFAQMGGVAVAETKVLRLYRDLVERFKEAESFDEVFARYPNLKVYNSDSASIASMRTLNNRTRGFLAGLSKNPASENTEPRTDPGATPDPRLSILESLIKGEKYDEMLAEHGMILRVKLVKLIGTRVTKSNLILGTRTRFSGSATAQFVLTDSSGRLMYADIEVFHTGFKKMSEIRKDQ